MASATEVDTAEIEDIVIVGAGMDTFSVISITRDLSFELN